MHTPKSPRATAPRWRLRATGAAVFGALMVSLAFPTFSWGFPILVAFVPALVVARDLSWKRRLRMGWLLGFLYHLVIFRWIDFTLDQMTTLPGAVNLAMLALYAAWHGLMIGVFLAAGEPVRRAAERRARWAGPLAVAAAWAAIEWAWPMVFPWSLGHAFWQVGPIATSSALGGVVGLAFAVFAVNALLADLWLHRAARRVLPAALTVAALVAFGAAWYAHVHATTPDGVLRVAVIQPNYTLEEKRRASHGAGRERGAQRAIFMDRLEALFAEIPAGTVDLVVASEGAFPYNWALTDEVIADADPHTPREHTQRLQRAIAGGPAAHTIIGGLRRTDAGGFRNSAVNLAPDGRVIGVYDKKTLVPFSEYVPGRDLFPGLFDGVKGISHFEPGAAPCAFTAGTATGVACGICYETIFTDQTRQDLGDSRLLVNLTIDTWFGTSTAPSLHLMSHATRAAELGVPLVRSALTGISAVIAPDGQVTARMGLDERGVLRADVPLVDVPTPYRAVGPLLAWILAVLTLGLWIDAFLRRRELYVPPGVPPDARTGPPARAEPEPPGGGVDDGAAT